MMALRREERPQDLAALADSLVDYCEQDVDIAFGRNADQIILAEK